MPGTSTKSQKPQGVNITTKTAEKQVKLEHHNTQKMATIAHLLFGLKGTFD